MLKRLLKEENGYGTVEMLVILAGVAAIGGAIMASLSGSLDTAASTASTSATTKITEAGSLNLE